MPYRVVISSAAEADLDHLARRDQSVVFDAIKRFLSTEPDVPSNARKMLDPNPLDIAWELRIGALRVFYDVEEDVQTVRVERMGRKQGNNLYLRGRRVLLRSDR